MSDPQDTGVPATPSGYSAEPEPSCTVSAADAVSIPNASDTLLQAARILDAHRADLSAEAVVVSFGSRGPSVSAYLDHYTVEIKVGDATYSASAKYPADAAALSKQKARDAEEARKRKAEKAAATPKGQGHE